MKRKNAAFFGLGIILVAVAVWQIIVSQSGLQIINLHTTNPPVTIIAPAGIPPSTRPTVLIAHGFAGSAVLMRGFALTLAHAGYTTVAWDFKGHGANPNPFLQTLSTDDLLHDAESALNLAAIRALVDTQRVAILGHSMGSGIALSYGLAHTATSATIAVSPFSQSVTPSLPHNLLIMIGNLQPQFIAGAQQLLAEAGGEGGNLSEGTARDLVIVPNVEHIAILFSPIAQFTARAWLDGTFGPQSGATNYVDRRMLWFGIGIVGFIMLCVAAIGSLPAPQADRLSIRPVWLRLVALVGGAFGATGILWLISLAGVNLTQILGLTVGGYIIVWFGVAGLVALLILRPHLHKPSSWEFAKAAIAFAALWLGVGLLGNYVWLPWLLIPSRLVLWVPASIVTFPWFFAIGEAASHSKGKAQVGWWLVQVLAFLAGLYLAFTITPALFFIFLILPVMPILLGLQSLAISPRQSSWAFAISSAMFTSWLLLAVFPLI